MKPLIVVTCTPLTGQHGPEAKSQCTVQNGTIGRLPKYDRKPLEQLTPAKMAQQRVENKAIPQYVLFSTFSAEHDSNAAIVSQLIERLQRLERVRLVGAVDIARRDVRLRKPH